MKAGNLSTTRSDLQRHQAGRGVAPGDRVDSLEHRDMRDRQRMFGGWCPHSSRHNDVIVRPAWARTDGVKVPCGRTEFDSS